MEQDFYRDRLASHGLTCSSPTPRTAPRCTGSSTTSCASASSARSRDRSTARSSSGSSSAGAQGIILGCTEIELLIGPADSPVPVFPTTRLHVEAAVDASLQP